MQLIPALTLYFKSSASMVDDPRDDSPFVGGLWSGRRVHVVAFMGRYMELTCFSFSLFATPPTADYANSSHYFSIVIHVRLGAQSKW